MITQQNDRYIRVVFIYHCPVLKVATAGHPHMCEYYTLLRNVLTKTPTKDYSTCASTHPDLGSPTTYASCVVFDIIHQNTFTDRWDDIQHALVLAQQPQLHPSLNIPQCGIIVSPTRQHGASPVSKHMSTPDYISLVIRCVIVFVLPSHTRVEVQKFRG